MGCVKFAFFFFLIFIYFIKAELDGVPDVTLSLAPGTFPIGFFAVHPCVQAEDLANVIKQKNGSENRLNVWSSIGRIKYKRIWREKKINNYFKIVQTNQIDYDRIELNITSQTRAD